MPRNLNLIENVLAYELVRRALLTRAILTCIPPPLPNHQPDPNSEALKEVAKYTIMKRSINQ